MQLPLKSIGIEWDLVCQLVFSAERLLVVDAVVGNPFCTTTLTGSCAFAMQKLGNIDPLILIQN